VDAVTLPSDVGSAFGGVEPGDVGRIGPASGVWNGMELLGVVTEVALVTAAGWKGRVELAVGHANKRRSQRDRMLTVGGFSGS